MAALTALGIGLLIAGTAMQAKGMLSQGKAVRRAGEENERLGKEAAWDALQRGEEDARAYKTEVRGLIGQERAAYAGQNVDVSYGTAREVQEATLQLGGMDVERIRRNAEREAQGFLDQGIEYARQGRAQQRAAQWGAGATILGGTGSLVLSRYGWEQKQKATGNAPTPAPKKGP